MYALWSLEEARCFFEDRPLSQLRRVLHSLAHFSLTLGYACLKILMLCFSSAFQDSSQAIPLVVESCIRFISRHGKQD